jgi:uncharacterized protein YheU (UPF0270 family)
MTIYITLNNDSESLIGSEGWDGYDANASVTQLKQNIANRVSKAFDGEQVIVDDEQLIDTKIYCDDEADEEYIRDLINAEWADWDVWAVEIEVPSE